MKTLEIKSNLLLELIKYGNSSPHDEVIALGTGTIKGDVLTCTEITKIKNVVKDPKYKEIAKMYAINDSTDYIPDPGDFFKVISETKLVNSMSTKELVLIFHTHPRNLPNPSSTDIAGANYRAIYVIYSPLYKRIKAYYSDDAIRYEPAYLNSKAKDK